MTVADFEEAGVQGVRMARRRRVIKGVSRVAGTHTKETYWLFQNLTMTVREGEVLTLVSRDPERTTAVLRAWGGLLPLDAGTMRSPARSLVLSPPQMRWVRELSVEQSIRMLAGIYGLTDDEVENLVGPAARVAQVDSMMHVPLGDLAGGFRGQIAFAVAVNAPVPLIMFDNTAVLGSRAFRPLCVEQIDALRDAGKAVVVGSIKAKVVLDVASRAVILRPKRGTEVEVAEAAEFLVQERVKGRKRARRQAHEDDEDSSPDF
jgi:ABC-type polysaccharide/polyol phosphate transport system ATPase subunit